MKIDFGLETYVSSSAVQWTVLFIAWEKSKEQRESNWGMTLECSSSVVQQCWLLQCYPGLAWMHSSHAGMILCTSTCSCYGRRLFLFHSYTYQCSEGTHSYSTAPPGKTASLGKGTGFISQQSPGCPHQKLQIDAGYLFSILIETYWCF